MERKTSSGKLGEGPSGTAAAIRDGKGLWATAPSCYGRTLSRRHQPLHRCHTWSQLRMTMQSLSHAPAVPTAMQQCPPGTHSSTHGRGAASPRHPRQHTRLQGCRWDAAKDHARGEKGTGQGKEIESCFILQPVGHYGASSFKSFPSSHSC